MVEGKLGKFGRILESTPDDIKQEFGMTGITVKKEGGVETLSAIATPTATPTATLLSTAGRKV